LQLIHQTFRLQYFKDVILAKILDEESSTSIILLIRLNHMAIVNAIDNDPEVLEVIRKLLQTDNMPLNDQIDVLKFFKEFLTISKTVALRKSLHIHQTAVVNDFMKFITRVLKNKSSESGAGAGAGAGAREQDFVTDEISNVSDDKIKESKLLAIGLFTNFIQHDLSQIRNYLIQNDLRYDHRNLLNSVIDMFTDSKTCSPVRWQLVSALKILLDTFNPTIGTVAGNGNGKPQLNPQFLNQALIQKSGEDFLNYFYPEYASRLLRPLIDFDKIVFTLTTEDSFFFKENLSEANCEILFHLGELLCNFINQHKYRIKYLVLRNLILQNALLLFKCREKHLQLTGLRIFRATLCVEDEFYFRFFIQHRSFSSLFALYKASGGVECDNLVTSAILEIFEFIRIPRDSLKALVRHLATVYRPELESYGPACVFRGILETEDRFDRESSVVSFASSQSQASNQSDQEMSPRATTEEEEYFSNIEEEDDDSNNSDVNIYDFDASNDFVPASKITVDDEEEDHFELLMKKNLPGSPTKKSKN
jgi:protein phosphatase 4 regulatory subunit 3